MGKVSTAEVLRLRATSAVSRDPSVRRSAQDDESVWEVRRSAQDDESVWEVSRSAQDDESVGREPLRSG